MPTDRTPRKLAAWGLVALVMLSIAGPPATARAPQAGLREIASAIAAQREAVKSMEVEVRCSEQFLVDREVLLRWLNKAIARNGTERYAFKEGKRYIQISMDEMPPSEESIPRPTVEPNAPPEVRRVQEELQRLHDESQKSRRRHEEFVQSKGILSNRVPKQEKPYPETRAYDGERYRTQSVEWSGMVYPGGAMPKHQFTAMYFLLVGIFVEDPTDDPAIREEMRSGCLPEAFDRREYSITPEELSGVPCLRLEAQLGLGLTDRIWLDPAKGFTLVGRDLIDAKTGRLTARIRNADVRQVADGVWLPMKCEAEEYAPPHAPAEFAEKPLCVTEFEVTRCSVNDVSDDLFVLEFKPGTKIADFTNAASGVGGALTPVLYTQGLDNSLDDSIAGLQKGHFLMILGVLNALAIGAFVVVVLRRRAQVKARQP